MYRFHTTCWVSDLSLCSVFVLVIMFSVAPTKCNGSFKKHLNEDGLPAVRST